MRRFLSVGFTAAIFCACSYAHSNHFEAFGGYAFSGLEQQDAQSIAGFTGWNASLAYKPIPWLAGLADFGGAYGSADLFHIHTYTFLFGPQVSLPRRRISPFAHVLFGETHLTIEPSDVSVVSSSRDQFSIAAGGGVDVRLMRGLAWRAQIDYLHANFHTRDNQRPYPDARYRVSTGIVFRF